MACSIDDTAQAKVSPTGSVVLDDRQQRQESHLHLRTPGTTVTIFSHRPLRLTYGVADAYSCLDDLILFSVRPCDIDNARFILCERARGIALVVLGGGNVVAPGTISECLRSRHTVPCDSAGDGERSRPTVVGCPATGCVYST